jgi:hypothetical protein
MLDSPLPIGDRPGVVGGDIGRKAGAWPASLRREGPIDGAGQDRW